MGRREQRERFSQDVRLDLAEHDLDGLDDDLDGLERRMTARFDQQDIRLGKIMVACVAILTSLVGALVLLALNLAIRSPG